MWLGRPSYHRSPRRPSSSSNGDDKVAASARAAHPCILAVTVALALLAAQAPTVLAAQSSENALIGSSQVIRSSTRAKIIPNLKYAIADLVFVWDSDRPEWYKVGFETYESVLTATLKYVHELGRHLPIRPPPLSAYHDHAKDNKAVDLAHHAQHLSANGSRVEIDRPIRNKAYYRIDDSDRDFEIDDTSFFHTIKKRSVHAAWKTFEIISKGVQIGAPIVLDMLQFFNQGRASAKAKEDRDTYSDHNGRWVWEVLEIGQLHSAMDDIKSDFEALFNDQRLAGRFRKCLGQDYRKATGTKSAAKAAAAIKARPLTMDLLPTTNGHVAHVITILLEFPDPNTVITGTVHSIADVGRFDETSYAYIIPDAPSLIMDLGIVHDFKRIPVHDCKYEGSSTELICAEGPNPNGFTTRDRPLETMHYGGKVFKYHPLEGWKATTAEDAQKPIIIDNPTAFDPSTSTYRQTKCDEIADDMLSARCDPEYMRNAKFCDVNNVLGSCPYRVFAMDPENQNDVQIVVQYTDLVVIYTRKPQVTFHRKSGNSSDMYIVMVTNGILPISLSGDDSFTLDKVTYTGSNKVLSELQLYASDYVKTKGDHQLKLETRPRVKVNENTMENHVKRFMPYLHSMIQAEKANPAVKELITLPSTYAFTKNAFTAGSFHSKPLLLQQELQLKKQRDNEKWTWTMATVAVIALVLVALIIVAWKLLGPRILLNLIVGYGAQLIEPLLRSDKGVSLSGREFLNRIVEFINNIIKKRELRTLEGEVRKQEQEDAERARREWSQKRMSALMDDADDESIYGGSIYSTRK